MRQQRKRKGRAKTVDDGRSGLFADVAALRPAPDALRAATPAPSADLDKYRRHLDHLDMAEDRKTELLRSLWVMMGSFVDRAFGDDAVQLARKAGDGLPDAHETDAACVIGSNPTQTIKNPALSSAFGASATPPDGRKR